MNLDRPDLVVPFRTISLRDRLYPYVLTAAIVVGVFLLLTLASIRGVY